MSVEKLYRDRDVSQDDGKELYAMEVDAALRIITSLQRSYAGRIDIRLTEETPSVTVMMIDRSKARISVNVYRAFPTQRPIFALSKARNPDWFKTFEQKYYIELWDKSRPIA